MFERNCCLSFDLGSVGEWNPCDITAAHFDLRGEEHAYAITADHNDIEGFVKCFAPNGEITVPGAPTYRGHKAISESLKILASLGVTYRHIITNSLIEVETKSRAKGICYLVTFNSSESADSEGSYLIKSPGTIGEDHDIFEMSEGEWKIKSRRVVRVFSREDAVARAVAKLGSQ